MKYNTVFGRIGIISPSFWFCKDELINYTRNCSIEYLDNTRMYFICGDKEGSSPENVINDMQLFYNLILTKGFDLQNIKYEVATDGEHNETSWNGQIGRVYHFLFP